MKTYLLACLWVLAGALGYLAYENRRQTNLQEKVLTRLQNATQKANREAAQTLQKIEKRDESALLAMLQKMRPTVMLENHAGKLVKASGNLSKNADLQIRIELDSLVQARYPALFQYSIYGHTGESRTPRIYTFGWRAADKKLPKIPIHRPQTVTIKVLETSLKDNNGKKIMVEPITPYLILPFQ